jgi:hypothetical protein
MKEPIFLAIILFRLCDGENSLEDDDFSTSEFSLNSLGVNCSGKVTRIVAPAGTS